MQTTELKNALVQILPKLRRYCYALTGSKSDADDILQLTVEKILKNGLKDDIPLDRWAFRVCKNAWLDEIRYRNVRAINVETNPESEPFSDGERDMINEIETHRVHKAMAKLPQDQRAALALVAVEGYSYAEAASILEVPIGTIMSRISRARKTLCDALLPSEPQPASL